MIAAAVALPVLGAAQGSDLGDCVKALKASLEHDTGRPQEDEWILVHLGCKGEEKSNKQGAVLLRRRREAEVPVAGRYARRSARAAKNKKEDVTDNMQRAAALIQQYVPPNPRHAPEVFDQGGKEVSGQILEPGKRNGLTFNSYEVLNDSASIDVDMTNNHILALQVATYLDNPQDTVSLAVQFANLVDGTGYPSQMTVDATKQNIRIVRKNSGYRAQQQ